MGREEQLISISIADNLHRAEAAVSKMSYIFAGFRSSEDAEVENPELDEAKDTLSWYIGKLYRDVGILAERMSLPQLASRVAAEFERIKY